MAKPKITSSRTRSTRSATKPVTKGQNPQRANRQAVSQAKVTRSRPSGARSLRTNMRPPVTSDATRSNTSSSKVTTGAGKDAMEAARARGKAEVAKAQARRGAKAASKRMEGVLKAAGAARAVVGGLKTLGRGGIAAAVMAPRPAGDATLSAAMKRGDYKPKQGPSPKTTQSSFNKKTFDQAFSSARKAGAKTFTWRGKKYTTKMKGE